MKKLLEEDCAEREAGYRRSIAISLKRIADVMEEQQRRAVFDNTKEHRR